MERRITAAPEIRIDTQDGKTTIVGYGAVFYRSEESGTEYKMFSDLVERIAPTAFDRAIRERHDAAGLFNHDPNQLLGRVSAGTMRLAVDERGLRYEIDVPDTQAGRDVVESIRRKDVKGSSFAFRVTKQTWQEQEDGPDIRVIEDLDLFDTGPVVFPAYAGTSTALRSADGDDVLAARDAWRRERESVSVRARLLALDNEAAIS